MLKKSECSVQILGEMADLNRNQCLKNYQFLRIAYKKLYSLTSLFGKTADDITCSDNWINVVPIR